MSIKTKNFVMWLHWKKWSTYFRVDEMDKVTIKIKARKHFLSLESRQHERGYTSIRSMIVNAINKESNVSTFIKTDKKVVRWVLC